MWLVLAVAGCSGGGDPARDGFLGGVAAISDGSYARQLDAQEANVARSQAESQALAAERDRLLAELGRLRVALAAQREDLAMRRIALPPEAERSFARVMQPPRPEGDPGARVASLGRLVADARALSETLALMGQ